MLRNIESVRNRKVLKAVKELDAFPKVPESYQETTASGGGVSIIVFIIIAVLVMSELRYYSAAELKYAYSIDTDYNGKLDINIDMTVAMKCNAIGADVLDQTGQNAEAHGRLSEEPVHFALSPGQQRYFDMVQSVNQYVREEYHAIHEFLWKSSFTSMSRNMPDREDSPTEPHDACRLHGTLSVNKVAGNFHITAGKSVPVIPRGHAHLSMMVRDKDYNFSHRIDQFSFGGETAGVVSSLDGELKLTTNNYHMFQYFIQVVPTNVEASGHSLDTYQYAVTEQNRSINHAEGSHGVPGIFVKYDLSSLKVSVKEEHKPYWQFLVRMCGIVGGIFATSGLIHSLCGLAVDLVCCRFKIGKYTTKERHPSQPAENVSLPTHSVPTSPLLSEASSSDNVSSQNSSNVNLLTEVPLEGDS